MINLAELQAEIDDRWGEGVARIVNLSWEPISWYQPYHMVSLTLATRRGFRFGLRKHLSRVMGSRLAKARLLEAIDHSVQEALWNEMAEIEPRLLSQSPQDYDPHTNIYARAIANIDWGMGMSDTFRLTDAYWSQREADRKGRALLRSVLNSDQLACLDRTKKYFTVWGSDGKTYRINLWNQFNVEDATTLYCLQCRQVSPYDVIATQKMMLETDVLSFKAIANAKSKSYPYEWSDLPPGYYYDWE